MNKIYAIAICILLSSFLALDASAETKSSKVDRPNILWISSEDISPNLGCYGDEYASTPNLDALAKQGTRFTRAFTHAGVCAVLRSGVITGVYPISIGSQHMRSRIVPPPHIKCFTEYMRAAGYYCTNRSKTDYQFNPPLTAWDKQGARHDDWRGRAKGQPFFSVINLTVCHESQIRHGENRHKQLQARLKPEQIHDPAKAGKTLPKYLPNTKSSRLNCAWYHDNISEMDRQAGEILKRRDDDGLSENTLVIFWSDHGQGMPRGKRWIFDSGTHVPVMMRWPNKLKKETVRKDLVTLLDLTKTTLAVAGAKVPDYLHGRILIGDKAEPEPEFLFFHRDRMDESYDLMRGARNRRFRYIRNYEPEKSYAQGIDYMDKMPTLIDWRRLNDEGKLNKAQSQFFKVPKAIEELYDIEKDPYEINNLAANADYKPMLEKMRKATEEWQVRIGDLGMIPEPILMRNMRPKGMETTAKPEISFKRDGDKLLCSIECKTPGSSIGYKVQNKSGQGQSQMMLYARPFEIKTTQVVIAVACRIGFKDSPRSRKPSP